MQKASKCPCLLYTSIQGSGYRGPDGPEPLLRQRRCGGLCPGGPGLGGVCRTAPGPVRRHAESVRLRHPGPDGSDPPAAVSYTHLDVYKRQPRTCTPPTESPPCRKGCCAGSWYPCIRPGSYTHRDSGPGPPGGAAGGAPGYSGTGDLEGWRSHLLPGGMSLPPGGKERLQFFAREVK